ncbi:hypothetical protein FQZ97_707320 [compost metagenome]
MGFVAPGHPAGGLHGRAHGTTVVGAVEQEGLDQRRVAGHEAAAQAGHVAALGERGERDQVLEVGPAELHRGFQAAQRGLVAEVDLAVALVGGDHEAVAVGQREKLLPFVQRHHRARGIARRADEHELGAGPDGLGHAVPVDGEVARGHAGHVVRLGAREQRRALVDLIERVGRHHHRLGAGAGVDHGLGEREQGLARAVDRQHLGGRVERQAVAAMQPMGEGGAQFQLAGGGRVGGKGAEAGAQGVLDEGRRGVLGLADAQADGGEFGGGRDAREQLLQPLERVRLQFGKQGIHAPDYRRRAGRPARPVPLGPLSKAGG